MLTQTTQGDKIQEAPWTEEQEGLLLDWANALVNGGRRQGKNALRRYVDGKPYECCLGVACDIFKERIGGSWLPPQLRNHYQETMKFVCTGNDVGESYHLPLALQEMLNLDRQGKAPQALGVYLVDGCEYENLEDANDAGEHFSAIGLAIVTKVRFNRERRVRRVDTSK